MVPYTLVKASEQSEFGRDGRIDATRRAFAEQTSGQAVELVVSFVDVEAEITRSLCICPAGQLPHTNTHVAHSLYETATARADVSAEVVRRALSDVLGEVRTALELRHHLQD